MVEPIRVAMIMGKMIGGGVESVVMNYYRHIDRNKVQFDFIIDNDSTVVPEKEIEKLGGRVLYISPYQKILKYNSDLEKIFNDNNYSIVHSHINALSVFPLKIAKKCGIPIRIAHNHSTSSFDEIKKNVIKYTLKLFSNLYPTHYIAPTYKTGEWLFGKTVAKDKLFILKNSIDISKFTFDFDKRNKIRNSLGVKEDEILIGNIGRLELQKNQKKTIEVFSELKKIQNKSKLLIIGNGSLKKELESLISLKGIGDSVTILPTKEDVSGYYSAMDLFLFPSKYEGLGIVAIEAQTNGLPVLASNCLPKELELTPLFTTEYLRESSEKWALRILENYSVSNGKDRNNLDNIQKIKRAGYEIKITADLLVKFYCDILTQYNAQ